jgi:hypothetical protein
MKEAAEDPTGCRKYSKAEIGSPMTLGGTSKEVPGAISLT